MATLPRKRIPGRTLRVNCPKCLAMIMLNWRRSLKEPQTIKVWVHPYKGTPVEVAFTCPKCNYRVSLGFDLRDYRD